MTASRGAVWDALAEVGDVRLRAATIELFDDARRRIAEDGVDLVILCARRLACIYQVLLKAGYEPIAGALVVSDRFLDLAGAWLPWQWKHVLILDDSVVLGTTLTKLHADVEERVAGYAPEGGKVESSAICVDVDRRATYLLDRLNFAPRLELGQHDVQAFSTDVVRCLYRNDVPFFSDFPVSRPIATTKVAVLDFVGSGDWNVADVTAPIVAGDGQTAYTLIPAAGRERDLLNSLPGNVGQLIRSFKLRVFVHEHEDGAATLTLVPLALLGACDYDDLTQAITSLCDVAGAEAFGVTVPSATDMPAAHRLMQMLTSWLLLVEVVSHAAIVGVDDEAPLLDTASLRLYFGPALEQATAVATAIGELPRRDLVDEDGMVVVSDPSTSAHAATLLDDDAIRELLWAQRELLNGARPGSVPERGQMTKVGMVASHAINSLFGYLSRQLEAPQQRQIRDLNDYTAYCDQFSSQPGERILEQAFTMDDLAEALLGKQKTLDPWDRALVSLGVDVGNDLGIVVPTAQADDERRLVYRGYRLGETAQLAENPLALWLPDDDGRGLDAFAEAVRGGYPIRSVNTDIRVANEPVTNQDRDHIRDLAVFVRERLPGKVVDYCEGLVLDDPDPDGRFDVEMTSIHSFNTAHGTFSLQQVQHEQQHWVVRGATVRWTIFERDGASEKDRTSRLFVYPSPVFTREAVERNQRRFAFLAETD